MTLYVDSSALLKRYLPGEPGRRANEQLLLGDGSWVTARHTLVEVRRNLSRELARRAHAAARAQFELDWSRAMVIELDADVCATAADIGEATGARTLDALHLAAAERVREPAVRFLTYDRRQAAAARALGWTVVGA